MITLVFNLEAEEFEKIRSGKKSFYIAKFKVAPVIGQQVIFQTANDEFEVEVGGVVTEQGIMKNYAIIYFVPRISKDVVDLTEIPLLRNDEIPFGHL